MKFRYDRILAAFLSIVLAALSLQPAFAGEEINAEPDTQESAPAEN